MDKHILLAKQLCYEGQELMDFVKKQQDLEREERVAQRDYEREKKEAKQKDKDREQKDKDREAAQMAKELEVEKIRLKAEQEDKDREATQNIKDKELEMEKWKFEDEVELKKMEVTSHPWGPKEKISNPRNPKLPYFDEHKDKMGSYLTKPESYVISYKWDPSMWASYLSA